jgi:hypothetical protein
LCTERTRISTRIIWWNRSGRNTEDGAKCEILQFRKKEVVPSEIEIAERGDGY